MTKMKTPPLFDGETAEQWDEQRVKIPKWLDAKSYDLRGQVGVILFFENGKVVAISIGTELKGGLEKRLADFYRDSPSGRNYKTGHRLYAERDTLAVEVMITGSDVAAQKLARRLKYAMIKLHGPAWHPPKAPKRKKANARPSGATKTVTAAEVVMG